MNKIAKSAQSILNENILDDEQKAVASIETVKSEYQKIGMNSGQSHLHFYLTANFLSLREYEHLKKISTKMARIIQKVAKSYFYEGKFSTIFKVEKDMARLYQYDQNYESCNPLARYDLFYDGKTVKFLEFNTESPSGIGRLPHIEQIFSHLPQFQHLQKYHHLAKFPDIRLSLVEEFTRLYDEWSKGKELKTIAIIDWATIKTLSDQKYIAKYLNAKGFDAFLCEPSEVKYRNNELFYKKKKIDLVYKRVRTSEMLEASCKDLQDALANNAVCVINPPKSTFLGDKRLLHSMSNGDFDQILTKEEIALIKQTIPWSRVMKDQKTISIEGKPVDLPSYVEDNKDKFVLKASSGFAGADVHIGNECDPFEWKKLIKRAKNEQWIVQEYVDIPTIDVTVRRNNKFSIEQVYINLCPFVVGQKLVGFLTRVSGDKIINTSRGGGIIPTYVIE